MKINDVYPPVEQSGEMPTGGFRIKASAKAFRVLSSGLYSDKIKAVIRELSTNAVDAHVAAGQPERPFLVHLPDTEEAYFAVRDFGPGLPEARIFGIYTTYFDSDKTDSDEANGCLGLGSKSPFAYDDHFQVTSWNGGVSSIYTAFLDSNGLPAIVRIAQSPADEPDGIEVRVSVKGSDFYKFRETAHTVYRYFRTTPIFGAEDCPDQSMEITKPDYVIRTPTMGILRKKKEGYNSHLNSQVVMGDVAYPVDSTKLDLSGNLTRELLKHGIDLYVPIGAVEMTASRESLEYTPRTIAAIKAAIEDAIPAVTGDYIQQIADAPTLWEARWRCYKLRSELGWTSTINPPAWNGHVVSVDIKFGGDDETPRSYRSVSLEEKNRSGKWLKDPKIEIVTSTRYRVESAPPYLFVDDIDKHLYATLKRAFSEYDVKKALLFATGELTPEFLEREGIADRVVLLSSIPKVVPVRRPRVAGPPKMLLTAIEHSDSYCGWGNETTTDAAAGGLYVEMRNRQIVLHCPPGVVQLCVPHNDTFSSLFFAVQALDPNMTTVFGIRTADIDRVKKKGNWVSLEDHAKSIFQIRHQRLARPASLLRREIGESFAQLTKQCFSVGSLFGHFAAIFRETRDAEAARKQADALFHLDELLNNPRQIQPAADMVAAHASLREAYPLLRLVDGYEDDQQIEAFLAYIRLIDNANAAKAVRTRRAPTKKNRRPVLQLTGS